MNEENKNIESAELNSETDQTPSDQPDQTDNSADQSGSEGEKTFTQADVDRIVKERLKRFKAKATEEQSADLNQRIADLDKRESDLKIRETKLQCKEYLSEKGYSADLLDILDTTNFETFKQKADKVMQLSARKHTAPIASYEHNGSEDGDGFRKDVKHKPKPYFNYSND